VLFLIVLAGVLWIAPSNHYLLLPDPAHPVDPLVTVPAAKQHRARDGGGIYFVDVIERKASLLERLFPGLHDGATLVPEAAIVPPGLSRREQHLEDQRSMRRSQSIAAAVALRALGYKVVARPLGVRVAAVFADSPAAGKLEPRETIVAIDGRRIRTLADLRRVMRRHQPGDSVRLGVKSRGGIRTIVLQTIADPNAPGRPIMGISPGQDADIRLPFQVRIDARGVVGPSAGLAFALDVMEELGRDVDHGYTVAATGELELDGTVGAIGGARQKIFGARQRGVDVFLVPAGKNAREARSHAGDVRVIGVKSFPQALRALATLPPKA
jgi:PDZ domain-containing protein